MNGERGAMNAFFQYPIPTLVEKRATPLYICAHVFYARNPRNVEAAGPALCLAVYLNLNAPYFSLLMATSQNWRGREKDTRGHSREHACLIICRKKPS